MGIARSSPGFQPWLTSSSSQSWSAGWILARAESQSWLSRRRFVAPALLLLCLASPSAAQAPTLAERLGYPRTAKLLILTSDDLGMTHSIDSASIRGLESGAITSGSVMVPCPAFPEIAAYARTHPKADLGIHLTLTAEWKNYRWRPLLPKERVRSLFDSAGELYKSEVAAAKHIKPSEAEAELRAQIDSAIKAGLHPTHLDSHMNLLDENRGLLEVELRLSHDYRLPLRISRDQTDFFGLRLLPTDVVLDYHHTIDASIPADKWTAYYTHVIANLKPGVTEMNVHFAYDDDEMRLVTAGHPAWGAAWRQRDVDVLSSDEFRKLVREKGVTLIGWGAIAKLVQK